MSKETFKIFVKDHPELVGKVSSGEMTWQKFYEMYDIYGEDSKIWGNYFTVAPTLERTKNAAISTEASLKELVNMVKKVDLETVRKGINGLQKAIGIVQDLGLGSSKTKVEQPSYQPRPMYKYFED